MVVSLSLEQFKLLALQYQKSKKKGRNDYYSYVSERSSRIKKRCGLHK